MSEMDGYKDMNEMSGMNGYKVGDKIEFIEDFYEHEKGEVTEVTGFWGNGIRYVPKTEGGVSACYFQRVKPYVDVQTEPQSDSKGKLLPNHIVERLIELENEQDLINKPNHYHKGGIDVLTYVKGKLSDERLKGFHQINIIKYVSRYEEKGGLEDLKKAEFYLKELIEMEKEKENEK